jgi:hypothetical protein
MEGNRPKASVRRSERSDPTASDPFAGVPQALPPHISNAGVLCWLPTGESPREATAVISTW